MLSNLPILMYHHISRDKSEGLTISKENLEAQFDYLKREGYHCFHFRELIKLKKLPSKKNVVITFDDIYTSQLEYAYPLLEKYGLKATFFAPLSYIGKTDLWNTSLIQVMTVEQLRSLNPSIVELGYHSFYHKKFHEITLSEIEEDTRKSFEFVSEQKLSISPVLAYPYGKYPRSSSEKDKFIKLLNDKGYYYGLRIGNRLNRFPFKNPFEIQRIDVKGEFSLSKFKRKLKFGKLF